MDAVRGCSVKAAPRVARRVHADVIFNGTNIRKPATVQLELVFDNADHPAPAGGGRSLKSPSSVC